MVNAFTVYADGPTTGSSISHLFAMQKTQQEVCRFLIVRMSADSIANCLTTISVKRRTSQFHRERLLTLKCL